VGLRPLDVGLAVVPRRRPVVMMVSDGRGRPVRSAAAPGSGAPPLVRWR